MHIIGRRDGFAVNISCVPADYPANRSARKAGKGSGLSGAQENIEGMNGKRE
jgi:hypothetical protein